MEKQFSGELAFAVNNYGKEKEYWISHLSGELNKSIIPYDNSASGTLCEKHSVSLKIDGLLYEQVLKICANQDHRIHMLLATVLSELIRRYTRSQDILLGTPIYKQDAESDFINTVLVIRNKLNPGLSFKKLLLDTVRPTIIEAIKHQNYPIEALFHQVNNSTDKNPLFDIGFLLENIQEKKYFGHIPYSLLFSFKNNGSLEGRIEYDAEKYHKSTIERLAKHFSLLLNKCLNNFDIPVRSLEIIDDVEKSKIIDQFNFTRTDYPDKSTIDEEFTRISNSFPDKAAVVYKNSTLSYKALNDYSESFAFYLNQQGYSNGAIIGLETSHSPEMIIALLAILKAGCTYLPVSQDFPLNRKKYLIHDCNVKVLISDDSGSELDDIKIICLKDSNLYNSSSKIKKAHTFHSPAYIMYTSGSTGFPKGVLIDHRSVVRLVKNNEFIKLDGSEKMLQTGALEFDASTFEIWGALLNGGCLILDDKENILDSNHLKMLIEKHQVTTAWMTSALYNQMIDSDPDLFNQLQHLLVGGDKLSPKHINKLVSSKKDIKIINGYGPTENTTFSATFCIDGVYEENIPIGKPISNSVAYIFDDDLNLTPVGVIGELYVGGHGISKGYINNPELTLDKFISHPSFPGVKLYKTGDLARWTEEGIIEFFGRKDFQIKIRGYRIEPGEIENRIAKLPGIKEVVVICKTNNEGEKYLCAYIVSEKAPEELMIREKLKKILPDFMIPAHFISIDSIPLTSNGKVDRTMLPEPKFNNQDIIRPRNNFERELIKIWSENLGIDMNNLSIDSNYFEIGGHSLKATNLVNQIHKELEVKVPLLEIFKRQTVRELAQFVATHKKESFNSIPKATVKDYYTLSPAQRRMFVLHNFDDSQVCYNIPMILQLEGVLSIDKIKKTFETIIERHDNLRISIKTVDSVPVQIINDHCDFNLIEFDDSYTIDSIMREFVRPFDLTKAPLIRVGYKKEPQNRLILIIDIHHIITDGTSMAILAKEFMDIYTDKPLHEIHLGYVDYSEWQNANLESELFLKQKEFWINKYKDYYQPLYLPYDFERPVKQNFEGDVVEFSIDKETTALLKKLQGENKTLFMVILAIYNILLSKLSNQDDIIIGSPIAGRKHADLNYTMGMFVNTLVFRNCPSLNKKFSEFLDEVFYSTTEIFENDSYPFDDLIRELNIVRDTSRNPLFDVAFSFHNEAQAEDITEIKTETLKLRPYLNTGIPRKSKFDLLLSCKENADHLYFSFEYCTKLFKRKTVLRFAEYFQAVIGQIVKNSEIYISEIEILTPQEKHTILNSFSGKDCEYPYGKTIHGIFEECVNKYPDAIAVQDCNNHFTYREINSRANAVANKLIDAGIKGNEIVALMFDRSPFMITAILGVLKAGGAYLPIDVSYPPTRVKYLLKDSNSRFLLTDKHREYDEVKELILTNDTFKDSPAPKGVKSASDDIAYIIYTSGSTGKPKGVLVSHENIVRLLFNDNFQFNFNSKDIWTMFHSYNFDFSVWEMYGALLYGSKLMIINQLLAKDSIAFSQFLVKHSVTVLNQTPSSFYNVSTAMVDNHSGKLAVRYIIFGGESLSPKKLFNWYQQFPQAKLINMYGITETTVHVTYKQITSKEINENENNIGSAIPTLKSYILDKSNKLLPPMIEGEIHVQGKGVARGYLNNPELTCERFIKSPFEPGKILYKSGDIGKLNEEGEIIYIGRQDNQIKIRGFRIEIKEIEKHLLSYEYITDGIVVAKTNQRNENYLCAYIVRNAEVDIAKLKAHMLSFLPEYMVPSYFIFLEKIPLTSNNKTDFKSLPEPMEHSVKAEKVENDILHEKLLDIFSRVLAISKEKIRVDDDFFDIGGNSLSATQVILLVHKELNVKLSLVELFRRPRITELAQIVRDSIKENYLNLKKAEKREYYPLSPAQARLYVVQQLDLNSVAYNMPQIFQVDNEINENKLKTLFHKLIERHDSFRTGFTIINNEVVQFINEECQFNIEQYALNTFDEFIDVYKKFIKCFDLNKPPLLRVAIISLDKNKFVLTDTHHIISDAVSQNILMREFEILAKGKTLKPISVQYKDYAVWLANHKNSNYKAEIFWLDQLRGQIPKLNLPYDINRSEHFNFSGKRKKFVIQKDIVERINLFIKLSGCTTNIFFYNIFSILLSKISETEDLIIGTVTANREHADIQDVIGFFVNMLAIRFYPAGSKKFADYLNESKTNIRNAYENQSYSFDELVNRLNIKRESNHHPLVDVVYSYAEAGNKMNLDTESNIKDIEKIYQHYSVSHFDLMLDVLSANDIVHITIEYLTELFSESTIDEIGKNYIYIIEQVLAKNDIVLNEIQLLNQFKKIEINPELYNRKLNF